MVKRIDKNKPVESCRLIQWEESCLAKGKPVCPKCGKPAEMIIGVFGNPCFAHK